MLPVAPFVPDKLVIVKEPVRVFAESEKLSIWVGSVRNRGNHFCLPIFFEVRFHCSANSMAFSMARALLSVS